MRLVVQRSKAASVVVDGATVGQIDRGLVLLVGVQETDTEAIAEQMAEKVRFLRVFEDETGKMNLDVVQALGSILSVSQFTLYGDVRKGRRPNYMQAARPDVAKPLYESFNRALASYGLSVETGVFGAMMDVHLTNDGPVTILIDSEKTF